MKSGNAGNSSKALSQPTNDPSPGEKPLFPPGSKFPLSLLHERQVILWFQLASVTQQNHNFSDVKKKGGRSLMSIRSDHFHRSIAFTQFTLSFSLDKITVGLFESLLARSSRKRRRQSLCVWSHTHHTLDQHLWKHVIGVPLMLYIGCGALLLNPCIRSSVS